ncbi:hypothetical protein TNCV_3625611 [Trichonephila clavipes]|nr:hypothetical protein TNCV_3625611 [Trichonephila clavipes]
MIDELIEMHEEEQDIEDIESLYPEGSERQACGRHKLLNVCLLRRIVKVGQYNRRTTVHQIAGNLNQGATMNVSEGTVRFTLYSKGYDSRRPV